MTKKDGIGVKSPQDDLVTKYVKEFKAWRDSLKVYWPEIDKMQEMFEFYKREASETSSDVSLNTPFAIVESMVSRVNDTTLDVTVDAKGINGMDELESYVASTIKDAIEDPDVAQVIGAFRKIKEMYSREFFVKGNAVAEVCYLYKTQMVNGKKVVTADNPYTEVHSYKQYIFNPAYYFDSSPVEYLEKYVSWEYLKSQEYLDDKKNGSSKGIYKNLNELKKTFKTKNNLEESSDHEDDQNISGNRKVAKKVEKIHLLERWEGAKLVVIANNKVVIREEYDPKKIGHSGILTSMNYKIQGRPYAYGEIDPIYKPVRAQDTVVNQSLELVNQALRPRVLVSDPDADLDAIIEIMEVGGVGYGNAEGVGNIPTNMPPSAAFQTIDTLQLSIERAARFSPYNSGVPNAQSDKTQGTMGGIMQLQKAAEPNFQIKFDAIQDTFMKPLGRTYAKMIGNLMGADEVRYGILRGRDKKWVMATKGLLTGKITAQDLITLEMVSGPEEATALMSEMTPAKFGQGLDAIVFDVDWVINCKMDSKSKADRIQEASMDMDFVRLGLEMGVSINTEKAYIKLAKKRGMEDIEDILLTAEEKEAEMEGKKAAMEQQAQMEKDLEDAKAENKILLEKIKADEKMKLNMMQQEAKDEMQTKKGEMDMDAKLLEMMLKPEEKEKANGTRATSQAR